MLYNLALKLNFKGKANVHWSERHGSGKNARTRHYRASETYFDTTFSLVGKGIIVLVWVCVYSAVVNLEKNSKCDLV